MHQNSGCNQGRGKHRDRGAGGGGRLAMTGKGPKKKRRGGEYGTDILDCEKQQ